MKPFRSLSGHETRFHWKSCGPGVTYAAAVKGKEEEAISAEAFEADSSFLCPRAKRTDTCLILPCPYIRLHLSCSNRFSLERSAICDPDLTIEQHAILPGSVYSFTDEEIEIDLAQLCSLQKSLLPHFLIYFVQFVVKLFI